MTSDDHGRRTAELCTHCANTTYSLGWAAWSLLRYILIDICGNYIQIIPFAGSRVSCVHNNTIKLPHISYAIFPQGKLVWHTKGAYPFDPPTTKTTNDGTNSDYRFIMIIWSFSCLISDEIENEGVLLNLIHIVGTWSRSSVIGKGVPNEWWKWKVEGCWL